MTDKVIKQENNKDDTFSINLINISEIPDDLRCELAISNGLLQDSHIIEILAIAGRPLDLNEILIGCYRKFNVKHKRTLLTARLYRLAKRGKIRSAGKGTYELMKEAE